MTPNFVLLLGHLFGLGLYEHHPTAGLVIHIEFSRRIYAGGNLHCDGIWGINVIQIEDKISDEVGPPSRWNRVVEYVGS